MPLRITPLVNDQIYHVFNRGIDHRPIFQKHWDYKRALETIDYYRNIKPPIKFSRFLILSNDRKNDIFTGFKNGKKHVKILAYCLMPNHFHLLLKQVSDNGVSKFMANFQNSYARFINTKEERTGPLLMPQFKSVRIETENQILHVTRYIHLNPYTSFLIKKIEDIENYEWSSFKIYLDSKEQDLIDKQEILPIFKIPQKFKEFTLDHADYQRKLRTIAHLLAE